MASLFKTLMTVKQSLHDSNSKNTVVIANVLNSLNGEQSSPFSASVAISNGEAYNITSNDTSITFENLRTTLSTTLSKDEISVDSIIDEGVNLSNFLSDVADSTYVNEAIQDICVALANSSTVGIDQARSLISQYTNRMSCDDLVQLESYLAAQGDSFNTQQFLQLLNSLYGNAKGAYENVANGYETTLKLDTTVVCIRSFVGAALLEQVGNLISFASLLLPGITRVFGFLAGALVSLIGNLLQYTPSEHFAVNDDVNNDYFETPVGASTFTEDVSKPTVMTLPEQVVVYSGNPCFDTFYWKSKEGMIFANSFLTGAPKWRNDAWKDSVSIQRIGDVDYVNFDLLKFNTKNEDDYYSHNEIICLSDKDLANVYAWAMMAYLLSYSNPIGNEDFLWRVKADGLTGVYSRYTPVSEAEDFTIVFSKLANICCDSWYHTLLDYGETAYRNIDCLASIAAWMLKNLATANSYTGLQAQEYFTSLSDTPTTGVDYTGYYRFSSFYLYDRACGGDIIICGGIPSRRTIELPEYRPGTILKTLLIIAGVTVAASTVALATASAVRVLGARMQLRRTGALNDLRSTYLSDPSKENFNALYKATIKYNLMGKLFGWGSYDMTNGWVNGPNSSSLASNISSSASQEFSVQDVIKLIH